MLTNPFQYGKNLTQASVSTKGGSQGPSPSSNNPTSTNVYMVKGDSFISTRAHDYSQTSTFKKGKEAELPSLPLQIENTLGETMTCIPKGTFKKSSHNPNARASQNYFVVEYLSQTPCAMSALVVLQSCPSQRKSLLTTLGSTETCNMGTIMLDTTDLKPCLPYHVVFQIVVAYPMKILLGISSTWWLMRAPRHALCRWNVGRPLASLFCLHHPLSSLLLTVIRSDHMVSFPLSPCS
jgi:hypothetical protein